MAALNNRVTLNNVNSSAAKEAEAIRRGPLTRRQKTLAKKRDANEERSFLLQLNEDLLSNVLRFLPGKDLAVLETVCTHFRYGSWVAVNKDAMPEHTAKRKLDKMELGDMPPGFRKMKWSRKLSVVEQRGTPLTALNITIGMWVRVKTDPDAVKKLCRGDGEDQDYAVGWEQGMEDTIGKPFPVGVVSRAYRQSPVVGLSVPNGLVAIAGGRFPTYGQGPASIFFFHFLFWHSLNITTNHLRV